MVDWELGHWSRPVCQSLGSYMSMSATGCHIKSEVVDCGCLFQNSSYYRIMRLSFSHLLIPSMNAPALTKEMVNAVMTRLLAIEYVYDVSCLCKRRRSVGEEAEAKGSVTFEQSDRQCGGE